MGKKFNISKKIKDNKKTIIIISSVIVVLITILCIFLNLNNDYIKRVKKVLSTKYYKIVCLDNTCDQIAAYKGSETGKKQHVYFASEIYVDPDGNETADSIDLLPGDYLLSATEKFEHWDDIFVIESEVQTHEEDN